MPNRVKYARQADLEELKADVREIKINHIPHLQKSLSKIQGELIVLVPLVISILGLIIYLLLRS